MIEFESVTTRKGDDSTSGLFDGTRLPKDHVVFEGLGKLDELTSHLGIVRATLGDEKIRKDLVAVQRTLMRICTEVATPGTAAAWSSLDHLSDQDVEDLETREQRLMGETQMPAEFVLPGETLESANIDVARAACRSAERAVVTCGRERAAGELAVTLRYLNRLSDYLFVLARHVEQHQRRSEA